AQVGAVGRRGVGLVGGDGPGPGAGPAGRAADPDLVQDGDEPGAVFGLPGGDDDGQRPAGGVDREMDLGGEAAPGAARGRGRQAGSAAPPHPPALVGGGIEVSVLSLAGAPFSVAALSRACSTSASTGSPAASWWARAVVESTLTSDRSASPCRAASAIAPSSSAANTPALRQWRNRS